jgi:hypothetical protein
MQREAAMPRYSLAALLVLSALTIGCSSPTEVSTVWKTSQPLPKMDKIVTLVVNASSVERRAGEDELARNLPAGKGIVGYTLVSDEDLKNRDKVKQILSKSDADGVLVVRLVAVDKTSTYYPPNYAAGYPYYNYYSSYAVSPGYTQINSEIHTEISLYSVSTQQLLWGAQGSTFNPDNIRDFMKQVAQASAKELQKQGLIATPSGGHP